MIRMYSLGILISLIFLNMPATREATLQRIQIYTPVARTKITDLTDKYSPAFASIIKDLKNVPRTVIGGKVVAFDTVTNAPVDTSDNFNIKHKSSITADQFDAVLREYGSPALGVGAHVVAYGNKKNVDAAYALYIFIHESTAGTNPNWVGMKGGGETTHNPGNIVCAGYSTCYGRFRDYPTWEDGFDGLIDLLDVYSQDLKTMKEAIARWAPDSDGNDPAGYYASLETNVRKWRAANNTKEDTVITTTALGVPTVPQARLPDFQLPADKEIHTSVLPLGGCLSDTVPNALHPSPKLQSITIPNGTDWSFNESWVIVDENNHYCGTVPYGGVCDMASRYQIAAKEIGLVNDFQRHSGGLNGIDYNDTVVIWSSGNRGGQDLIMKNNTGKTAQIRATIEGDQLIVKAWLE